jgi:type IV secretory pathway protease TraF
VLSSGEVMLAGDNRSESYDSRYFAAVHVLGRAVLLVRT